MGSIANGSHSLDCCVISMRAVYVEIEGLWRTTVLLMGDMERAAAAFALALARAFNSG